MISNPSITKAELTLSAGKRSIEEIVDLTLSDHETAEPLYKRQKSVILDASTDPSTSNKQHTSRTFSQRTALNTENNQGLLLNGRVTSTDTRQANLSSRLNPASLSFRENKRASIYQSETNELLTNGRSRSKSPSSVVPVLDVVGAQNREVIDLSSDDENTALSENKSPKHDVWNRGLLRGPPESTQSSLPGDVADTDHTYTEKGRFSHDSLPDVSSTNTGIAKSWMSRKLLASIEPSVSSEKEEAFAGGIDALTDTMIATTSDMLNENNSYVPSHDFLSCKAGSPARLPVPGPKVVINVPPSLEVQARRKRERARELLAELKENPSLVDTEQAMAFLGRKVDDRDYLEIRYNEAAPRKRRKINRSALFVDIAGKIEDLSDTPSQVIHPRKQAARYFDKGLGSIQPALTFNNNIDSQKLDTKFQFVSEYIISRGAKSTSDPSKKRLAQLKTCFCTAQSSCLQCACSLAGYTEPGEHKLLRRDFCTYEQKLTGLKVLSDAFLTHKAEGQLVITECSEKCGCGKYCVNKVTSQGRQLPLELFKTERCGFGVRSSQNIMKGQFIDLYFGELITLEELSDREAVVNEDTPSYAYTLDAFSSDENKILAVDGSVFGSITRFINHSCKPNCKTFVVIDSETSKFEPRMAFFAIKDIPAGIQLTIDYCPECPALEPGEKLEEGVVICQCGEEPCRGRLWPESVKGHKRKSRLNPSVNWVNRLDVY